ncbi:MAG: hypothetical protein GW893_11900, partial [Armatimonadetes bacterium]|nr:hypothetical protein [Armatimonadota bacterium]
MTRRVRVGILGGGGILGAHAAGFRAHTDKAEVVAVAEPRPEQVEWIQQL